MRIDFIFDKSDKLFIAYQITSVLYLTGQRLIIFCNNKVRMQMFNSMLWSFNESSFIPHVYIQDPLALYTPIVLVENDLEKINQTLQKSFVWLINLSDENLPNFNNFERVFEIVSNNIKDRISARKRWRNYQVNGYDLRFYALTSIS